MSRLASALAAVVLLAGACHQAGCAKARPDRAGPEKLPGPKEDKGLAVSLAPAGDGPGRFLLRWKNVGRDTLELPWVRFGSHPVYKGRDDLWHHVFVKKPDGTLLPARKHEFPEIMGPAYRPRTVILQPGKVLEETIGLWTYVEKPAEGNRYEMWVELNIQRGYAPSVKGATYWTGKVRSNILEVDLAK